MTIRERIERERNNTEYMYLYSDGGLFGYLYDRSAYVLSHYKSFNLLKKYLDRKAFYNYFVFSKGFRKAMLRPEYGGKANSVSAFDYEFVSSLSVENYNFNVYNPCFLL